MVEVRESIQKFAECMEKKMRRMDSEKGDSWKDMSIEQLEFVLDEEEWEYLKAREGIDGNPMEELIDRANVEMMLFHKFDERRKED